MDNLTAKVSCFARAYHCRNNAAAVPCDLSEPQWKDHLTERGFRPDAKTFASLLGISYYLSGEAFKSLLKTLRSLLSEGSAICFDYPSKDDGREMEALLEECGFLIYEHLNPQEMTAQYFSAYNERCPDHGMEAPEGVGYILAAAR